MRLTGGLGNQLFQYALGRRIAIDRNQKLFLDVSLFPGMKTRSYKLDGYNICADIISKEKIGKFTYHVDHNLVFLGFRFVQRFIPYYRRRIFSEQSFQFDPNVFRIGKSAYIKGSFQSEKYFFTIKDLLMTEFTPRFQIDEKYLQYSEKILASNSISLHVRRGDYVSNPRIHEKHGVCPISYYKRAVDLIQSNLLDARFYIFSDDIEWAKANLDFIRGKTFIDHRENSNHSDIQELWLMSLCKNHIIANSSYSWWGAWLAKNNKKIVIATQKWFLNSPHNTKDLLPEDWIKI